MSKDKSTTPIKFVLLLGDGMADYPIESLGGKTPLEAAETPNMDRLAAEGCTGTVRTVPLGMHPGSDVANLAVLGYDPSKYYTGRGPLEASSMGVHLGKDDIAFRCNLVTVEEGRMVDYSAGHISTEEGGEIIKSLSAHFASSSFYPGVSYRHLLVMKKGALDDVDRLDNNVGRLDNIDWDKIACTPPHDITGEKIEGHLPKSDGSGNGSSILRDLMERSVPVLAKHPVNKDRIAVGKRPASMIWPWGQGRAPKLPTFKEKYSLTGAMISAVDLLKGIGRYAGLEVIDVPGATGFIDTNYGGKVDSALAVLRRVDFVFLHVEAPDEAGHAGDLALKIRAIEDFDSRIVGPVVRGLLDSGYRWRACVLPDHPTPIALRTHTSDPVPFAIAGFGIEPDGVRSFDEKAVSRGGYELVEGYRLMDLLMG